MPAPINHKEIFDDVLLLSCIIGALCSVMLIVIIHLMKAWNGHLFLIYVMSWCQLLYDITLYPNLICPPNLSSGIIAGAGNYIGGWTVALFSNIIAGVVLFVIVRQKTIKILNNYHIVLIIVFTPAIVAAAIDIYCGFERQTSSNDSVAYLNFQVYYYFRLFSIALNIVVSCMIYLRSMKRRERLRFGRADPANSPSATRQFSTAEAAVRTLAYRMAYYPIVQTISRFGLSWYEISYSGNSNYNPDNVTVTEFVCQMFVAIISPAASVGYLIIFLIMQPKAYKLFRSLFQWKSYVACVRRCGCDSYCCCLPLKSDNLLHFTSSEEVSTASLYHVNSSGRANSLSQHLLVGPMPRHHNDDYDDEENRGHKPVTGGTNDHGRKTTSPQAADCDLSTGVESATVALHSNRGTRYFNRNSNTQGFQGKSSYATSNASSFLGSTSVVSEGLFTVDPAQSQYSGRGRGARDDQGGAVSSLSNNQAQSDMDMSELDDDELYRLIDHNHDNPSTCQHHDNQQSDMSHTPSQVSKLSSSFSASLSLRATTDVMLGHNDNDHSKFSHSSDL